MPLYVEKDLVDGQKRYYVRTYVVDSEGNTKQVTRHNKLWVGLKGKNLAMQEEVNLKNEIFKIKKHNEFKKIDITLKQLKNMYIEHIDKTVDKDTLNAKKTRLNHFCEIDNTNQVKTYPNKKLNIDNQIWLEIYSNWKKQMIDKKYNPNKYSKIEKNFSIDYLNRIHNEICGMLDYGIINNFCKFNFAKQCGKIGTPKEIKLSRTKKAFNVINYEEYLRLLDVSKDNLRYNTYFDLSFSRGPRTGEVRAFRICDYNPDTKQLMVNYTLSKKNEFKEPKTSASKAPIDLDDEINRKILKLINYWKQFPNYNDNWFLFNGATPISSHSLEEAKNKYFKLAGINRHIRLHDFRHSCATWLLSINTPLKIISQVLRHANIEETLKTYAHLLKKDYYDGLDAINEYKNNNKNF